MRRFKGWLATCLYLHTSTANPARWPTHPSPGTHALDKAVAVVGRGGRHHKVAARGARQWRRQRPCRRHNRLHLHTQEQAFGLPACAQAAGKWLVGLLIFATAAWVAAAAGTRPDALRSAPSAPDRHDPQAEGAGHEQDGPAAREPGAVARGSKGRKGGDLSLLLPHAG